MILTRRTADGFIVLPPRVLRGRSLLSRAAVWRSIQSAARRSD
jgi:hypothetical protein